jgi:uncharacterized protein YceK
MLRALFMEEMPMSVLRPVLCLIVMAVLSGCGAKMMRCTSASGSWAIGRVADQGILDRIQAESGAKQIRTLADGETSSDIGMDRVTVHVNAQNLVTAVTCD